MKNNDDTWVEVQKMLKMFSGNHFDQQVVIILHSFVQQLWSNKKAFIQKRKRKANSIYTIDKLEITSNVNKIVKFSEIFNSYGLVKRLVTLMIVWYNILIYSACNHSYDIFKGLLAFCATMGSRSQQVNYQVIFTWIISFQCIIS